MSKQREIQQSRREILQSTRQAERARRDAHDIVVLAEQSCGGRRPDYPDALREMASAIAFNYGTPRDREKGRQILARQLPHAEFSNRYTETRAR